MYLGHVRISLFRQKSGERERGERERRERRERERERERDSKIKIKILLGHSPCHHGVDLWSSLKDRLCLLWMANTCCSDRVAVVAL